MPTSSTYEIAYYMFSKENVLQVGGHEAASIYGYVNGYIVDDTGLNVSYGEYKQNVKFSDNPDFNINDCLSSGKSITINRYVKGIEDGYVKSETTDKFFEYRVARIKIVEMEKNGIKYYVLKERIVLNSDAAALFSEGQQYYAIPVFYTKGLPTDTQASENPSIYAEQYFYAYTLSQFISMKVWDADVKGITSDGIYSVINQMDNKITAPQKDKTQTVILKYVTLTERSQLKENSMGNYELTETAINIPAQTIGRYEYNDTNFPGGFLVLSNKLHGHIKDGYELIAYSKRLVSYESELKYGKNQLIYKLSSSKLNLNSSKAKFVEIIVYSVPKNILYTVEVTHETKTETQKASIPGFLRQVVSIDGVNKNVDNVAEAKSPISIYQFYGEAGKTPIFIRLQTYSKDSIPGLGKVQIFRGDTQVATLLEDEAGDNVDVYIGTYITDVTVKIKVLYESSDIATSPAVQYDGTLIPDTVGTDAKCNSILSVPNEDVPIYVGLDEALMHYVKGVSVNVNWDRKESSEIDGGTDTYNTSLRINIDGPSEGDEYPEDVFITNNVELRARSITRLAVYSISNIKYFDAGTGQDTSGERMFNYPGMSYNYSWGNDKVKISVDNPNSFNPSFTITATLSSLSTVGDWTKNTSNPYPLKNTLETTMQDFKDVVMDIISPYAFTEFNPYARDLGKLEFEVTQEGINSKGEKVTVTQDKYDYSETVSGVVNKMLNLRSADDRRNDGGGSTRKAQELTFSLDFSKIYVLDNTVGLVYDINGDKVIDEKDVQDNYLYIDLSIADYNHDGIINYEDIKDVYKTTNKAYANWLVNNSKANKEALEAAYAYECKIVDIYDEALVMQALAEMFANLNDISWYQITGLEVSASYNSPSASVTVKQSDGTYKETDVVIRSYGTAGSIKYSTQFINYNYEISDLYESGYDYSIRDLDYDILRYNIDTSLQNISSNKFMYWGINRRVARPYTVAKTLIRTKTIEELVKDDDGKFIKVPKVTKTTNQKLAYGIEWGYVNGDGKFVMVEDYYYHNHGEEMDEKYEKNQTYTEGDAKINEIITISDKNYSPTITYSEGTSSSATDYKNNVVDPIKNITKSISDLFNDNVWTLLESKYVTLARKVEIDKLTKICSKDPQKLQKLMEGTTVNIDNIFKNVYGLESLSELINALNGKSVAQYVTDDTSIVKGGALRSMIDDTNLPKMNKISADLEKIFIKEASANGFKYIDNIYNNIYLDDVLIYIANNFDEYYYDGIYMDLWDIHSDVYKSANNNVKKYVQGLLYKINYLELNKEGSVAERNIYDTYLADMSYNKLVGNTELTGGNGLEFIKMQSNIIGTKSGENSLLNTATKGVGSFSVALFVNIVNGFDAYLSTLGIYNNSYNYYKYLSTDTLDLTDKNAIESKLNYILLQNTNNVIANFDIHFDAFQSHYNWWLCHGVAGQKQSSGSAPVSPGSGGLGFLTKMSHLTTSRLRANTNAYNGTAVVGSVNKGNDIIGSRTKLPDFESLANLFKIKNNTENGERTLAAEVTYELSAQFGYYR